MSDAYFDDLLQEFSEGAVDTMGGTCPPRVQPQTRMIEPGGPDGLAGHPSQGELQSTVTEPETESLLPAANNSGPPGPESDIALLLDNLRFDFTGAHLHDIDEMLALMVREAMLPLSRQARAELAVMIDDLLAEPSGRQQAMDLLKGINAQDFWPQPQVKAKQ